MKKIEAIINTNLKFPEKLKTSEGIVEYSQSKFVGIPNLTIKLKDVNAEFWIRGQHRIDVGERVRFHYDSRSNPFVVKCYEILSEGDEVKYRSYNSD